MRVYNIFDEECKNGMTYLQQCVLTIVQGPCKVQPRLSHEALPGPESGPRQQAHRAVLACRFPLTPQISLGLGLRTLFPLLALHEIYMLEEDRYQYGGYMRCK